MEPQLNMEIEAMRKCASAGRTNHVAKLLDSVEENGYVFLRIELCTISLEDIAIQRPGRRIPESECAPWARQLFFGLQEMHGLGIVHRDIKPENLLISREGKLKIVDFGWCAYLSDLLRNQAALAGTFQFMAPEVLEEQPQTEAVDMWSSGCTLIELLTGAPLLNPNIPPTGYSNTCERTAGKVRSSRVLQEIRQKCPLPVHGKPSFLSPQCWAFCQGLLMPQASTRMTLQSALDHHWLRGPERSRSWAPQLKGPNSSSRSFTPQPQAPSAPSIVTKMANRSYAPQAQAPRAASIVNNNLIARDARVASVARVPSKFQQPLSWDGSTTASSSGSTPRAMIQRMAAPEGPQIQRNTPTEGVHTPLMSQAIPQVCAAWPSMGAQPPAWQSASMKPPLLAASPETYHRTIATI
jgi:serine/threonine protein kinase